MHSHTTILDRDHPLRDLERPPTPSTGTAAGPHGAGAPAGGCPIHTMFRGVRFQPLGRRVAVLATGVIAYLMFFGTILYAIGFVANLVVPKGIDDGAVGPAGPSLLINGALLALFVVQHTVMARPAFKRWFTRFVPAAMERSLFVAAASGILMLTFWQWRPLPQTVWNVEHPALAGVLLAGSMLGWAVVFGSSFMINHFDLFGLRQSVNGFLGRDTRPVGFKLVGLYKLVRHPLMVGFLLAFWLTPTMSVGHLFFAVMTTGYIFFGTWIEERDLVAHLGDAYLDYKRRVRGFVPLPRRAG
jgi:protein-S-isoprenylcysteine O-methyltransferase Ste14